MFQVDSSNILLEKELLWCPRRLCWRFQWTPPCRNFLGEVKPGTRPAPWTSPARQTCGKQKPCSTQTELETTTTLPSVWSISLGPVQKRPKDLRRTCLNGQSLPPKYEKIPSPPPHLRRCANARTVCQHIINTCTRSPEHQLLFWGTLSVAFKGTPFEHQFCRVPWFMLSMLQKAWLSQGQPHHELHEVNFPVLVCVHTLSVRGHGQGKSISHEERFAD